MGFICAVYFSNWSVYESKHFALDLPTGMLSHVFYAFLKVDRDSGAVVLSDPWADTEMPMVAGLKGSLSVLHALKLQDRSLKVIMSIGGWGTHDAFSHVMKDPKRMHTFVRTAVDLVTRYSFDGIDVDWEYPENTAQASQLVHVLGMLRHSLDQIDHSLTLSVAAPAAIDNISVLLVGEMDRHLTFWNVMCYDFCGAAWSSRTGHHSNLYGFNGDNLLSAELVIEQYIRMGVPPRKLVLGMPMYGRSFRRPAAAEPGARFSKRAASTDDIVEYHAIDRANETYDERRVAASLFSRRERLWISYENPQSVAQKAQFVVRRGLGGGFFWDSKGDTSSHELLNAFTSGIGGQIDVQPNRI
ncbi:glycoside hydrolase [Metschnikowia bicuspidata var. bicuspidata NRRL YB-4993]|uniref:chitinase n=1 Tax=Metschnikowia bicuspidata var. bicuspidata NRRL YB-4993 TaxID=869754 RepID=A0A1A0HJF0_9ASCO|nr:glycoside hydrolase [Metschnikowia bicuspidata var. bicuspidata NRRL YB-4993]OBA24140.1 glycoside hydrolase [Metschnikowia bicuspidata var. bicuspidata NRRL YB-4993]